MKDEEVGDNIGTLESSERSKNNILFYFFFFKQKTAYEIYQCDWSSDVCSSDLAKQLGTNPRRLAEKIIAAIPESDLVEKIELAGPGFINFFLAPAAYHQVIKTIIDQGANYGFSETGKGKKILLEYVSANPTGPLHVGHGRGAAYGATLATLLETVGYQVDREYYVNDAGRQMDILATSIWLRYLDLCGEKFSFPVNGYQGRSEEHTSELQSH